MYKCLNCGETFIDAQACAEHMNHCNKQEDDWDYHASRYTD